jgi:hypothetical protein
VPSSLEALTPTGHGWCQSPGLRTQPLTAPWDSSEIAASGTGVAEMARKAARPLAKAIQYTVPGHVIGGSEPRSWKVSQDGRTAIRVAANKRRGKQPAVGPARKATFASECFWCGRTIKVGATVAPIKVSSSSRQRWVHTACTRAGSTQADGRISPPKVERVTTGGQKTQVSSRTRRAKGVPRHSCMDCDAPRVRGYAFCERHRRDHR